MIPSSSWRKRRRPVSFSFALALAAASVVSANDNSTLEVFLHTPNAGRPQLELLKSGWCEKNDVCDACQGNCYGDDDVCGPGLKCLETKGGDGAVPGCDGKAKKWTDYCYRPEKGRADGSTTLLYSGSCKDMEDVGEICGVCQGHCDGDDECGPGLKCFERDDDGQVVPGCEGKGEKKVDYCYRPAERVDGPTLLYSGLCEDMDEGCGVCQGHCDDDDDLCGPGLKCFERDGDEGAIPGCEGKGEKKVDYCYRPVGRVDGPTLLYSGWCEDIDDDLDELCGVCQGNCDGDDDCGPGLKCFERDEDEAVPGCEGKGEKKVDYCFRPESRAYGTTLLYSGSCEDIEGGCGVCQGHCDDDDDLCGDGLKCFERKGDEEVPGCVGKGKKKANYCYRPKYKPPPQVLPSSETRALSMDTRWCDEKNPCNICEGDCEDDDNVCGPGLKCFERDGNEAVPGCVGEGERQADYCYRPEEQQEEKPRLKYIQQCDEKNPCGVCEGDCDDNKGCDGGLKCFQRDKDGAVPGCSGGYGGGDSDVDYCYDPGESIEPQDATSLTYVFDCNEESRCGKCTGECEDDSDCAMGLECFERKDDEGVPGCDGDGDRGMNYCFDPDDADKCSEDSPCEQCMGHCEEDSDCAEGLECFERQDDEDVPGCKDINAESGVSVCFDPDDVDKCSDDSPCEQCIGHCEKDSDCAEGLACFEREEDEDVPGCEDIDAESGESVCFDPADVDTPNPTPEPSPSPTKKTHKPTDEPSPQPTLLPTMTTSDEPTLSPTRTPSDEPTPGATFVPTPGPNPATTDAPTEGPTEVATILVTFDPTGSPSAGPTTTPTTVPTNEPTQKPSSSPTTGPTMEPTTGPTMGPTTDPTAHPSSDPTSEPTATTLATSNNPTAPPTSSPSSNPISDPPVPPVQTVVVPLSPMVMSLTFFVSRRMRALQQTSPTAIALDEAELLRVTKRALTDSFEGVYSLFDRVELGMQRRGTLEVTTNATVGYGLAGSVHFLEAPDWKLPSGDDIAKTALGTLDDEDFLGTLRESDDPVLSSVWSVGVAPAPSAPSVTEGGGGGGAADDTGDAPAQARGAGGDAGGGGGTTFKALLAAAILVSCAAIVTLGIVLFRRRRSRNRQQSDVAKFGSPPLVVVNTMSGDSQTPDTSPVNITGHILPSHSIVESELSADGWSYVKSSGPPQGGTANEVQRDSMFSRFGGVGSSKVRREQAAVPVPGEANFSNDDNHSVGNRSIDRSVLTLGTAGGMSGIGPARMDGSVLDINVRYTDDGTIATLETDEGAAAKDWLRKRREIEEQLNQTIEDHADDADDWLAKRRDIENALHSAEKGESKDDTRSIESVGVALNGTEHGGRADEDPYHIEDDNYTLTSTIEEHAEEDDPYHIEEKEDFEFKTAEEEHSEDDLSEDDPYHIEDNDAPQKATEKGGSEDSAPSFQDGDDAQNTTGNGCTEEIPAKHLDDSVIPKASHTDAAQANPEKLQESSEESDSSSSEEPGSSSESDSSDEESDVFDEKKVEGMLEEEQP